MFADRPVGAGSRPGDAPDELARLKDTFLCSLNHEIRTPLSGILGMTDLLLETPLNEEQQEYVNATRQCAENLLEVLNSALELSALAAGSLKLEETEFHLPDTLRAAVYEHSAKAEAKGLRLLCSLEDHLPETVVGDAVRLRQVLAHIVGNALKFTHEGEVEVSASSRRGADGRIHVMIHVRDTGIGIAPEQLGVIFDSFHQVDSGLSRSYFGVGLGLTLAQRLTRLMRGEITAQSDLGHGSMFSVEVPFRAPLEFPVRDTTAEGGRRHKVLVVEDNPVAQKVVTHILRRGPYFVDCVDSGADALDAVVRRSYDVILMDLQMPGMNGLETTAAIRRLDGCQQIPILAFTANTSDESRARCREYGMQGFLSKPVQSEELLTSVARWVKQPKHPA